MYAKDSLQATFGFKKIFLMLTEVGKLIAISSSDGSIQWTEYLGGESEKIIVRNMLESEGEGQQIVSILRSSVNIHSAADGKLFKEYPLDAVPDGSSREFIMVSVAGGQYVLAITSEHLKTGKPLSIFPPIKLESLDNVYFTHIDKDASVVKGYRLRKDLIATLVWTVSLGKERYLGLET